MAIQSSLQEVDSEECHFPTSDDSEECHCDDSEIQRFANFVRNGGPPPSVAHPGVAKFRLLKAVLEVCGWGQSGRVRGGFLGGIENTRGQPMFDRIRQLTQKLLGRKVYHWFGAHVTLGSSANRLGKGPIQIRYKGVKHDFGYRHSRKVPVLLVELKINGRWTDRLPWNGQHLHLTIGQY